MATKRFLGALMLLGLASTPALAQYNFYQSPEFLQSNVTTPNWQAQQRMADKAREDRKKLGLTNNSSSGSKKPAAAESSGSSSTASTSKAGSSGNYSATPSATNNPLPYQRDKALSAKIREDFLRDYAKQMPDDVESMRAMSTENDLVQIMAGVVRLQGLDSGTMEGFIALWYGQSWAIANQKPMPTPQQYQGIAAQIRGTSAAQQWTQMSDAARQTFFEQRVYPLFIQKANYQAYLKQGKTDAIARMASATQQGLKKAGMDMTGLNLNDKGFAPM
jgi:hypothetical protein